jgi:hypothetical protein
MLHRYSHREERSVADRDHPALARQIQHLAESGDYEGFNAVIGALIGEKDFDAQSINAIKPDGEFRNRITDICQQAWARKHASAAR